MEELYPLPGALGNQRRFFGVLFLFASSQTMPIGRRSTPAQPVSMTKKPQVIRLNEVWIRGNLNGTCTRSS